MEAWGVVLMMNTLVSKKDIICFLSWLQPAKGKEKQMPAAFFLLPRHKQDAGSYKDSIIKSTENN